ncbi:MAG TPA: LysE family transporter [Candidatus Nitrosocosmicus sp.]|nr:LysE family transporter [Candidatus Nitrosocosmicus sp.]
MYKYFIEGLLLGLAYVAPIGMQNLYVINTAIKSSRLRAYQVAFITVFFDISLALACFFGIGIVLENVPVLRNAVLVIGSIMVIYIGIGLIRSTPDVSREVKVGEPLARVALICFTVTWLNPQAIIDGTLLLGGFKATLPAAYSNLFIAGVAAASFCWFTGLATIVSTFKGMIGPKVLRSINVLCGSVIVYYGLKLAYTFIKGLF